jgi:vacuolar-type H+-ATPase subunit I/STV1
MIVEMKKFHLVVLEEDKDNLLRALQKNGNIMLINQDDTDNNNKKFYDSIARVK